MGQYTIKLPDVGEGVAEAELVEWLVEEGQNVREDEVLASVMTDKATVEIPSPVEGRIIWRGATIGETVSVGTPIIRLEVDGEGNTSVDDTAASSSVDTPSSESPAENIGEGEHTKTPQPSETEPPKANGHMNGHPPATQGSAGSIPSSFSAPAKASPAGMTRAPRAEGEKPLASPAVRLRAREGGIDLRLVAGSGPAGRITHADLDAVYQSGTTGQSPTALRSTHQPDMTVTEVPVIGLRRKIAEKMATAKSRIPHITYVDEVDVTDLEKLRTRLNNGKREGQPKLTILPFLMRAMVRAIEDQPQMSARFDDEAGIIHQSGGIHIGIATQTDNGLIVPVVRHAEALSLWACASEMKRLADACRDGSASREELSGSTITITSLGAMGGIVTTPVINHPEVAIIGVNKMQIQPVWDGNQFVPRKIMNLSSSFDHRVIDGWDCAVFIQRIKGLLESPAEIFIED